MKRVVSVLLCLFLLCPFARAEETAEAFRFHDAFYFGMSQEKAAPIFDALYPENPDQGIQHSQFYPRLVVCTALAELSPKRVTAFWFDLRPQEKPLVRIVVLWMDVDNAARQSWSLFGGIAVQVSIPAFNPQDYEHLEEALTEKYGEGMAMEDSADPFVWNTVQDTLLYYGHVVEPPMTQMPLYQVQRRVGGQGQNAVVVDHGLLEVPDIGRPVNVVVYRPLTADDPIPDQTINEYLKEQI